MDKLRVECEVPLDRIEDVADALDVLSGLTMRVSNGEAIASFRPFEEFRLSKDGLLALTVQGVAGREEVSDGQKPQF